MNSGFVLSHADGRPLYLQVIDQMKARIAVGDWKPGDPLPSIRQLAVDLQVSVITIKRAYMELEREGVIVTHHGKGSTVAPRANIGARIHEQELAKHLEQVARLGVLLGLGPREIHARLREATNRLGAAVRARA